MIHKIFKSRKITSNQKIFLLAGITIPFFLCFSNERQSELTGMSLRTIYRIKKDFVDCGVLICVELKTFEFNYKNLSKIL